MWLVFIIRFRFVAISTNRRDSKYWALSIQQKFRFEISEILCPQRTVHSGCIDLTQATARLVIVLVSTIQETGTGDNNFVKWKGTFRSDRPTEMTRPVKEDHLQSWSKYSSRIEPKRSVSFDVPIEMSGILG